MAWQNLAEDLEEEFGQTGVAFGLLGVRIHRQNATSELGETVCGCGAKFIPVHVSQRYCSPKCKYKARRRWDNERRSEERAKERAKRVAYRKQVHDEFEAQFPPIAISVTVATAEHRVCWCGTGFAPKNTQHKHCSTVCKRRETRRLAALRPRRRKTQVLVTTKLR